MKNFKSLILGSAAAVFAVAGAQAADLPVKAKPVEYVKVCSAYGAGFYYIPGTDICLRVGGFLFSDFTVNNRGNSGSLGSGANRDRNDDWTAFRIRQSLILDARTNTEYGTLRSYFSGGFQWDTSAAGNTYAQASSTTTAPNWSWYYNSAFIQFAGFTFGIANSFFDFDPSMVMNTATTKSFSYSPMIAYTAQLGSGISATIAMEDGTARREQISFNTAAGATTVGGFGGVAVNQYAAQFMPDFIANLRVDQAWGDAQIAGAIHQVKSTANGTTLGSAADQLGNVKYGYAFMGGLNFKLPSIGAKDSFQIEGVWSRGAEAFTGINSSPYGNVNQISYVTRGTAPMLDTMDAFFNPASGNLDLVKAYSANAQFRHFWTPTLRSSVVYGYLKVDNPNSANTAGISDGRLHQGSVNLIWSPVKNLDIGTEVYYNDLKTTAGSTANNGSNDWWGGNFRVTRYW
jgi:hypothetical protein